MAVLAELKSGIHKSYILDTGEIKAVDSGDEYKISGWASTKDLDLADDIVLPTAFKKNWDFYATKGRYWLNHNADQVIGKVVKAHLTSDGFYIDEAQLVSDLPLVKDYVWPLVKAGALSEHSIQFLSLDPEIKDGILYHTELKLIETSIVSVACNPEAVITGFKHLIPAQEFYRLQKDAPDITLEEVAEMSSRGVIKYPSEVRQSFYMSGFRENNAEDKEDMSTAAETPTVDLADFKVLVRSKDGYDPKGTPVKDFKLPSLKSRNHEPICDMLYLAKSESRKRHMFRVATPTAKGWQFDWANVAVSMGNVLGAKGGAHYADGERAALIKELCGIYTEIGKKIPTHEGDALDTLSDEALSTLKYHEVEFREGEDRIMQFEVAKSNLQSLVNVIQAWQKGGGVPEEFQSFVKSIYGSMSFYFSVYPRDQEDMDFVNAIVAVINAYLMPEAPDGINDDDDDDDYYMYALTDLDTEMKAKVRMARFGKSLMEGIDMKYLETKSKPATEEVPESGGVVSKGLKALLDDDPDMVLFGDLLDS